MPPILTKRFLLHLLKNELYSQQRIRYSWGTVSTSESVLLSGNSFFVVQLVSWQQMEFGLCVYIYNCVQLGCFLYSIQKLRLCLKILYPSSTQKIKLKMKLKITVRNLPHKETQPSALIIPQQSRYRKQLKLLLKRHHQGHQKQIRKKVLMDCGYLCKEKPRAGVP